MGNSLLGLGGKGNSFPDIQGDGVAQVPCPNTHCSCNSISSPLLLLQLPTPSFSFHLMASVCCLIASAKYLLLCLSQLLCHCTGFVSFYLEFKHPKTAQAYLMNSSKIPYTIPFNLWNRSLEFKETSNLFIQLVQSKISEFVVNSSLPLLLPLYPIPSHPDNYLSKMDGKTNLFSPPPHHYGIQATITPYQDACGGLSGHYHTSARMVF